jgi:hypothetical protein
LPIVGFFSGAQSLKALGVVVEVSQNEIVEVVACEGVRFPSVKGVEGLQIPIVGFCVQLEDVFNSPEGCLRGYVSLFLALVVYPIEVA